MLVQAPGLGVRAGVQARGRAGACGRVHTCAHACAQAPGLEELCLGGVLDLRVGPWDALGRLARLERLDLCHSLPGRPLTNDYEACYGGPPPADIPVELPLEALPPSSIGEGLWRYKGLGWLLELYPHLAPPGVEGGGGQDGGAGQGPFEGQPQQEGRRHSAQLTGPQQEQVRVAPAEPPAFRLAWLPPGLRACFVDLPWGTRVDRGSGHQGDGASGPGGGPEAVAEPPPPGPLERFRLVHGCVRLP
jgi:hypothetical protein